MCEMPGRRPGSELSKGQLLSFKASQPCEHYLLLITELYALQGMNVCIHVFIGLCPYSLS